MGTKVILIAATLLLASCGTVGLTGSFCDPRSGIEPIRLTAQERAALSTEAKRNILAVNTFGERNCNWRP